MYEKDSHLIIKFYSLEVATLKLKTKQGLKQTTLKAFLVLIIISITGCSSGFKTISPDLTTYPQGIKKLGHVEGKACGSIIANLIPAAFNTRVERAYKDALSQKPEATAIINTSMDENWIWWYFGLTRCVIIEGEAIK